MMQGIKRAVERLCGRKDARILIVSDKPFVKRHLAEKLDALPGMDVIASVDYAQDATFYFREVGADAVILDLEFGGDAGILWLESLLPHERRRCILLSNFHDDDPFVIVGLGLGAAAYVYRPEDVLDTPVLLDQLQLAIGKARNTPATPRRVAAPAKLRPAHA
jgi:DNA-binding NarL/FixJ family response regulator